MFIAILISFGHFSAVHARVTSEVPLTMLPHLLPEVLFPSFPPSFYFSLSHSGPLALSIIRVCKAKALLPPHLFYILLRACRRHTHLSCLLGLACSGCTNAAAAGAPAAPAPRPPVGRGAASCHTPPSPCHSCCSPIRLVLRPSHLLLASAVLNAATADRFHHGRGRRRRRRRRKEGTGG